MQESICIAGHWRFSEIFDVELLWRSFHVRSAMVLSGHRNHDFNLKKNLVLPGFLRFARTNINHIPEVDRPAEFKKIALCFHATAFLLTSLKELLPAAKGRGKGPAGRRPPAKAK